MASIFCGTFICHLGADGRLSLPPQLRRQLKGQKIVLVGCGKYGEFWPEEEWEKESIRVKKILEEVRG